MHAIKCHKINSTSLPGAVPWAACNSSCLCRTCGINRRPGESKVNLSFVGHRGRFFLSLVAFCCRSLMEWGSCVCKVEHVFRAPPEPRAGIVQMQTHTHTEGTHAPTALVSWQAPQQSPRN